MTRRSLALGASILALSLTPLSACGSGDEARDDTTSSSSTPDPSDPTGTGSGLAPTWPAFGVSDYRYRLRVLCYCPPLGPVDVNVVDGAVESAVIVRGPSAGTEAPDYARLSIDDILDAANAAQSGQGSAEVVWPDGQDHPTSIAIDRIPAAVDDEVTYTIRGVVLP